MRIGSNAFTPAILCICTGLSALADMPGAYSDSTLYSQKIPAPVALMPGMMMAGSNPDLFIPLTGLKTFFQNWWVPPVEDYEPVEFPGRPETFSERLQRLAAQYPDKDMEEIWQMALNEEEQPDSSSMEEMDEAPAGESDESAHLTDIGQPSFFTPRKGYDISFIQGVVLIPLEKEENDSKNNSQPEQSEKKEAEGGNGEEQTEANDGAKAAAIIPPGTESCFVIKTEPRTGASFAYLTHLPNPIVDLAINAVALYQDQSQRKPLSSGAVGCVEYIICQELRLTFKRSISSAENPQKALNEKFQNRAARENLNEIQMLTKFRHENIQSLLAVIPEPRTDGRHTWILMSLWEGDNLWEHLYKFPTRMSIVRMKAFIFAFNMVSAVNHLHQQGIVHCDIKAKNFVVRQIGDRYELVLLDFGVARVLNKQGQANTVGGSQMTVAPELQLGPPRIKGIVTRASDAFSLGTIFGRLAECDIASPEKMPYKDESISIYDYYCALNKANLAHFIGTCYPDEPLCQEVCDSNVLPARDKDKLKPEFFRASAMQAIQYLATMMVRKAPKDRLSVEDAEYFLLEFHRFHSSERKAIRE